MSMVSRMLGWRLDVRHTSLGRWFLEFADWPVFLDRNRLIAVPRQCPAVSGRLVEIKAADSSAPGTQDLHKSLRKRRHTQQFENVRPQAKDVSSSVRRSVAIGQYGIGGRFRLQHARASIQGG